MCGGVEYSKSKRQQFNNLFSLAILCILNVIHTGAKNKNYEVIRDDKLQCIIYIRGLSEKALEILGVVLPRANPAWKTASIKYSISMASLKAGLETI